MKIISTCDSARRELERTLDALKSEIPSNSIDVEGDFIKAIMRKQNDDLNLLLTYMEKSRS